MMSKKTLVGLILAVTGSVSLNVMAENIQAHAHEKTFSMESSDVNQLSLSSLTILSDQQFVFNNELALLDWDSFFNSYAPHLKNRQDVILNWAGLSSINPKLLLALMELKSNIISAPLSANIDKPFGDLTAAVGFSAQVKDISNQLSQYFYSYIKLQQDASKGAQDKNRLITPTSAATVALTKVLSNSVTSHDSLNSPLAVDNHSDLYDVLSSYEKIFAQSADSLLDINSFASTPKTKDKAQILKSDSRSQLTEESQNNAFSMRLPWPSGNTWRAGGAHSNTGSGFPYSSLDFYNSHAGWGEDTPWVQSANSGRIVRFSTCNVRVIHSSGYATSYYHMSNLQHNSRAHVNAGDWLGKYANSKSQALCEGGQSTGPHLHFSLLNDGQYTSLQGHMLGNYRVSVGRSNYDSDCRYNYLFSNGRKTCANNNIYN